METTLQPDLQLPPQGELLRYAQLAAKDLTYRPFWEDISAPLRMSLRVVNEICGDRGQGLLWRGRFDLAGANSSLTALRNEAAERRVEAYTFPGGHHLWNSGGPAALALGRHPNFKRLLETACGRELGEPMTHYNYYEQPQHRAYPHIDVPESHLNTVLMLQHSALGERQSRFVLYPYLSDPVSIDLEPGELVLFWGGATVHERSPLIAGEHVQVLSVGYTVDKE